MYIVQQKWNYKFDSDYAYSKHGPGERGVSSSMEKQQHWTMGPATVNSENVQSSQGNLHLSLNQKMLNNAQLKDGFKNVWQERFQDMSLPSSFSTSTSSMVSKYWLQGRGEKSRFLPGLQQTCKMSQSESLLGFRNTLQWLGYFWEAKLALKEQRKRLNELAMMISLNTKEILNVSCYHSVYP